MNNRRLYTHFLAATLSIASCLTPVLSLAEGEAGIISLRAQGHFFVGMDTTEPSENGSVQVMNQVYVGYQLAAEKKHPYPIVLVHGGSGQSTHWFSTPDNRDGWRDYFLAAGFDVYWVDRPGYGRSPTSARYGELHESASTGIITFLAQSEQWPGDPDDHMDPTVIATLADSPPGPYGGDILAAKNIGLLLDRIGPSILMTYSAGAVSGWWAADLEPDNVAAIIGIEPTSSNITSNLRKGLSFEPPLERGFEPFQDEEGCQLQPPTQVSTLPTLAGIPIKLIGSELGLIRGLPCAVKAFAQASVDAEFIYLPDQGITGNGHFMMVERNNGEIARAIIEVMKTIE